MAEVIKMPRLSDTMEEGTVASWLKKKGDKVEEGDILAEIETDKATMEFESFYEGTLLHIGIQEGETAKVQTRVLMMKNQTILTMMLTLTRKKRIQMTLPKIQMTMQQPTLAVAQKCRKVLRWLPCRA